MTSDDSAPTEVEAAWLDVLNHRHHSKLGVLPSSDRCNICRIPLGGISGAILRPFGHHRSRMNPQLCNI